MTLAGNLLMQLRIDKGYGHSRAAFVARYGIRWGEHIQRFLEVGRTRMHEDFHLAHLVDIGLVRVNTPLYYRFQAAITRDGRQKRPETLPHVHPSCYLIPARVPRVGENDPERFVREIFESLLIDGLFDLSPNDYLDVSQADETQHEVR